MSTRDTYVASVSAAAPVKTASVTAAQMAHQETINASGVNAGYYSGKGGSGEAAFQAAVKAANIAKLNSIFAAEQARQAAIAVAKDTLKSTGDLAPC